MKTAICFGAFDLFHEGHKDFLKQNLALADTLIVVVGRSKNIQKLKNKAPLFTENERVKTITNWAKEENLNIKVELGDEEDFFAPIKNHKPNFICLGYDQKASEQHLKDVFPNIEIVRMKAFHPETFKSSLLKEKNS